MTITNSITEAARGVPWPLLIAGGIAALAVLALTTVAIVRAGRAAWRVATAGLARAQSDEDPLTAVLAWIKRYVFFAFGGGMILSASYGMIRLLVEQGAFVPVAVAFSLGVEGLMIGFTIDLYHRSRTGKTTTMAPRVASWLFAGVSAYANSIHPIAGVHLFALAPLIGLFAIEWQAGTERHANHERGDSEGFSLSNLFRRTWGRLWATVAVRINVDSGARDTDVERDLRARKAATRMRIMYEAPEGRRQRRAKARYRRARQAAGVDVDPDMYRLMLTMFRADINLTNEAEQAANSCPWPSTSGVDQAPPAGLTNGWTKSLDQALTGGAGQPLDHDTRSRGDQPKRPLVKASGNGHKSTGRAALTNGTRQRVDQAPQRAASMSDEVALTEARQLREQCRQEGREFGVNTIRTHLPGVGTTRARRIFDQLN